MNLSKIAAQLYSFQDFIKTPAGLLHTLRRLRGMGYEAVQLSGALAGGMPAVQLLAILQEAGMQAPTCHYDAKAIVDDPQAVIARLHAIACAHIAYPYPAWMPTGEAEAVAFARELERAAQLYQAAGIELAYHNHAAELARFGSRTMLDILYDEAKTLQGELDTYWIHCGGGSPAQWLKRLAGRQRVLHLKDYGMCWQRTEWKPGMMSIGAGNLNWDEICAAAEIAGVEWYVVEHDGDVTDPFASFAESMQYLKAHFIRESHEADSGYNLE